MVKIRVMWGHKGQREKPNSTNGCWRFRRGRDMWAVEFPWWLWGGIPGTEKGTDQLGSMVWHGMCVRLGQVCVNDSLRLSCPVSSGRWRLKLHCPIQ